MNLKTLTEEVEKVSQIHTEKFDIKRDETWFVLKLQEEMGELVQSYLQYKGQAKTKGKTKAQLQETFAKEVADVLCHTLLLAKHTNVDIEKEIEQKWLVWRK